MSVTDCVHDRVLVVSAVTLLIVSRAGGWCLLAGPDGNVCSQDSATGGDDGQAKPQPGAQSGATGHPPRQGAHNELSGPR